MDVQSKKRCSMNRKLVIYGTRGSLVSVRTRMHAMRGERPKVRHGSHFEAPFHSIDSIGKFE